MEGVSPTLLRFSRAVTLALFLVLAVWTALILVPSIPLRFVIPFPKARLVIETLGATVAILTFALAYLHYSLSGARSWFFVALAFVPIAFNRLVFGVFISPSTLGTERAFYIWTTGRLMLGALLLVGALRLSAGTTEPAHPLRRFLFAAAVVVGILAAVEAVIWILGDGLPPVSTASVDPGAIAGALPGLGAAVLALGGIGTLLYVADIIVYLRRASRLGMVAIWLPPALVFATFSHIHHTLFPSAFGNVVSTGDALRLGFAASLLVGVTWEVRRTYHVERERRDDLAAAYASERDRVGELEELERAREELTAVLTHELLHPVAALRGLSVALTQQWEALEEGKRRELVGRMERQSAILRDLAEYVRTGVEVERGGFSVATRRESALEIAQQAAEGAKEFGGATVVLAADEGRNVRVVADRTRIQQVLRNLLSNAFKYAGTDQPVGLSIEAGDGEVTFSVIDRGPGIPNEDRDLLFKRFSRLRRPGMENLPGSGLGLYISRRIVEAHGGRIWVETNEAEGSTFRFTVPRAR